MPFTGYPAPPQLNTTSVFPQLTLGKLIVIRAGSEATIWYWWRVAPDGVRQLIMGARLRRCGSDIVFIHAAIAGWLALSFPIPSPTAPMHEYNSDLHDNHWLRHNDVTAGQYPWENVPTQYAANPQALYIKPCAWQGSPWPGKCDI